MVRERVIGEMTGTGDISGTMWKPSNINSMEFMEMTLMKTPRNQGYRD